MGYFDLLPQSSLRMMYLHRYPPVTVRPHNGHVMNSEEFLEYKETLAELLSAHYIDTLNGGKISYARFLTDALILIHFVQYRAGNRIRGFNRLCEAFAPYFTTTEWFAKQRTDIIQVMSINDLQLYDFY